MFTELYYIEMAALYLMVSKLQTYNSVTMETPVWGPDGLFEKLESYFVDDYPLINRRHDFTTCKQARGEVYTVVGDEDAKGKGIGPDDDQRQLTGIRTYSCGK